MSMTNLSEHFTLEEATLSETASRAGIDNSHPPEVIVETATRTATKLEKVRALLGKPVVVSSFIRCLELNRLLGSKDSSQHLKGEAVDFICPGFGSPLQVCQKLIENKTLVRWDQLILEHTWVHISWNSLPNAQQRGQILSLLSNGGYAVGLTDKFGKSYI